MKLRYLLLSALIATTNAVAATSLVSFDDTGFAQQFVQDGFRFEGSLTFDYGFPSSPAIRIYGNVPLTISRLDGNKFSLESFNLLSRYDTSVPWWISNEFGQGFPLSRSGEYLSGQFMTSILQNVSKVTVFDPSWTGTNYYIFDDFKFSYSAPATSVPEPTSSLLLLLGFGFLSAYRYRMSVGANH